MEPRGRLPIWWWPADAAIPVEGGAVSRRGPRAGDPQAKNPRDRGSRKAGAPSLKSNPGKWCTAGRHWLPLEAFPPNENLNSGRDSWCRACRRERVQHWRAANPEYIASYNERRRAEYRAEHPRTSRPCVVCGKLEATRRLGLFRALPEQAQARAAEGGSLKRKMSVRSLRRAL